MQILGLLRRKGSHKSGCNQAQSTRGWDSGISTFNNVLLVFITFLLFRATPTTYGSFQARGLIGSTAAGLHHSHSNVGSEPSLQPTPQLKAMPEP